MLLSQSFHSCNHRAGFRFHSDSFTLSHHQLPPTKSKVEEVFLNNEANSLGKTKNGREITMPPKILLRTNLKVILWSFRLISRPSSICELFYFQPLMMTSGNYYQLTHNSHPAKREYFKNKNCPRDNTGETCPSGGRTLWPNDKTAKVVLCKDREELSLKSFATNDTLLLISNNSVILFVPFRSSVLLTFPGRPEVAVFKAASSNTVSYSSIQADRQTASPGVLYKQ